MSAEPVRGLAEALRTQGVDVYLATHTTDIRWLTGFAGVFDSEQAHVALMAPARMQTEAWLFTDMRYSGALRRLNTQGYWHILDERIKRFVYVAEVLARELGEVVAGRPVVIGIESDLRLDWFKALDAALAEAAGADGAAGAGFAYELREMTDVTTGLRARKSGPEIEVLKAAQAITDAGFDHMLEYARPGLTEKEVAVELEFFMRRAGASGLAFPSIVASGPNSALPHAVPGERVLQRGDILLMDFGARLDDYCSDMTRTVVLGQADERQQEMYAAVLEAHLAASAAYAPGMECATGQQIAEDILRAHGYEAGLVHGLGHGVGIDIHELPVIGPKVAERLEVGNVVTVEPGVYLEGVGGVRIEDCGVVTAEGFESFARAPKQLIEL